MLILCGLLSRQIVYKVYTCYLSLCSIFLSHNILFVAPGLVLPLFHFQLLLLLLLLFTAIELSIGGSSLYTSTGKTNKNKYT